MKFAEINSRRILYLAFFASLVSSLASTAFLFFSLRKNQTTSYSPSPILERVQTHMPKNTDKTEFNILLLGYGGLGHAGGSLSDAIILANINTEAKVLNFIAIPRDIWIEIPVRSDKKEFHKINMAFAIGNDDTIYPLKEPQYKGKDGGGNMAKHLVGQITGLAIDFYAAVDFNRFEKAIDSIGGITVDVPVAFTDQFYPIKGEENNLCDYTPEEVERLKTQFSGFDLEKKFKCRYETLSFKKGKNLMDGATALKFVRSRHSIEHGGDFARGTRQQAVLSGFLQKLVSLDALKNIDKFYTEFSKLISTDVTADDLVEILSLAGKPEDYSIKNIQISTDNYLQNSVSPDGQYILIPKAGINNWQEVNSFIKGEKTPKEL